MKTQLRNYGPIVIALLLTLFAVVLPLGSRGMAQNGGRPVIVVLPDVFPQATFSGAPQSDARVMIMREPGKTDVIVLNPAHATPGAIAAALVILRRHRTMMPDPQHPTALRVTEIPSEAPQRSHATLSAILERLQRQPHGIVGRLGRGRQIELDADAAD